LAGALEPEGEPSLFNELLADRTVEPRSWADIPTDLRHEVQDEAIRATLCRLQGTLRALLSASTPGGEPRSVEECVQLFHNCRHALEQEVFLTADAYPGAVRSYTIEFERDYTVHGRCQLGEPVRIVVPCWRLRGHVVVRGEAEPMTPTPVPEAAEADDLLQQEPLTDHWFEGEWRDGEPSA
jgi:hypothetical protein